MKAQEKKGLFELSLFAAMQAALETDDPSVIERQSEYCAQAAAYAAEHGFADDENLLSTLDDPYLEHDPNVLFRAVEIVEKLRKREGSGE
jgi:hypothetical protein